MDDLVYFSRRAKEAREAAMRASDSQVRNTHLKFAAAYDVKVRELRGLSRRSKIRIVALGDLPAAL